MALDSPAAFNERVLELELSEHLERFTRAKWKTLGDLAFAAPQGSTEVDFRKYVLEKGLGNADHDDAGRLRRLFFEAFVLAGAQLKLTIGGVGTDGPRKVSAPERRERFKRVEDRLKPGVLLRGELEVSEKLIDRCVDIWDNGSVKYLPLEFCTKREMEIQGIEKDPLWASAPDPVSGLMTFRKLEDSRRAAVDSQFAFIYAMMRRGLALEMADLVAFEKHELLKNHFVAALMEEPMEGFQRVTFDQVYRADLVFFTLLNDASREGIKRRGNAARPLDVIFEATLIHPRFVQSMTPRQTPVIVRGAASLHQAVYADPPALGSRAQRRKRLREDKPAPQAAPEKPKPIQQALGGAGAGKGKGGKGKGDGKGGPRLPAGLFGMCPRSNAATENKRLCFSFNLGTCKLVGPGQECAKGWHLCMKPTASGQACSLPHGATSCTAC
jgi:hypothetical protein